MAGGTFLQNYEAVFAGEEIPWNQRQCCNNADVDSADSVFVTYDDSISMQTQLEHALYNGWFNNGVICK